MHRIAYDYQIFFEQKFGGISRYFCELARAINNQPGFQTKVFAPVYVNSYLEGSGAPHLGIHLDTKVRGTWRLYRTANAMFGPLATAAWRPSLMHQTSYTRPRVPSRVPTVVTVLDMIHELYPADFPADDPTSQLKRESVARADHVICISHSTAADLMRLFDVPASKITVIHLAHSSVFDSPPHRPGASSAARPYVLYVGNRSGYKNFAGALQAYAASALVSSAFDLVAFGGSAFTAAEQELIGSHGLRPQAVRQVAGSDRDLAEMYRNARAFIYPSKYEGFGIPPLEAMSCGCPVLSANTSSLPEVVADAALLFDPQSIEAMKAALESVCLDDSVRLKLISDGLLRAASFSWKRCGEETVVAYEGLLR